MAILSQIIEVIEKIKKHCTEIDNLSVIVSNEFQSEKQSIEQKASELIKDMQKRFAEFKYRHFGSIKDDVKSLIDLLCEDYRDEWNKTSVSISEFNGLSFEENEKKLHELINALNLYIDELNNVNFDALVPPVKFEVDNEVFKSFSGNHENEKQYDCNSSSMETVNDPKPIRKLVSEILPCCKRIDLCVDALTSWYEKEFNIAGFDSYVNSSARAWIAETKAK